MSDSEVDITWGAPAGYHGNQQPTSLVYALYWRDSNNADWINFATTTDLMHVTSGPHYLYENLEFKLVAVTSEGVVAEAKPVYPQQPQHIMQEPVEYPVPADSYDNLPMENNLYYNYEHEEELLPVQASVETVVHGSEDVDAEEGSGDVDQQIAQATASSSSSLITPDPYRRSFLLAMGGCVLLSLVVLFLVGLLLWSQRRFREVVVTRTAAFRSRTNSLRESFTRRKSPSKSTHFVIDMESQWPVV